MRRRQIINARAAKKQRLAAIPDIPKEEAPVEIYTRMFGKPPHHRMKPETILEKIKDGNTSGCSS